MPIKVVNKTGMSTSGEEEGGLSIPYEETSLEEELEKQPEESQNELDKLTKSKVTESAPSAVTFKVLPSSQSSFKGTSSNNKISTKKMTSSNSPDPERENVEVIPKQQSQPRSYDQLSEENEVLTKLLQKQEEHSKILAKKLIGLVNDRRNKTKREEILLEEQKARISDLENEVTVLRDKLHLSKQQLASYTRLIPNHHHPPSRQTSMLSSSTATTSHSKLKKPRSARSNSGGVSVVPAQHQHGRPSTATSSCRGNLLIDKNFTDKVEELLLEAKAENQALEDQLKHCRQRLTLTEEELEKVKADIKTKEADHLEEIMSVKAQLGKEQDLVKKKKQLSDNIQLIRLQRDSRRASSWLSTLEAQCRSLESRLQSAQENGQQLETQLLECQEELGNEQQRSISLQKQFEDATSGLSRLKELEAQIASLQEENNIMKETNESLLKKAFNVTEKAEKAETQEVQLKVQMSHLETVLKAEMKSKSELQQCLRTETEKCLRLEMTNEKLQDTLTKLNEEMKQYVIPKPRETFDAIDHIAAKNFSSSNAGEMASMTCPSGENCPHEEKASDLEKQLNSLNHKMKLLQEENNRTKLLLCSQVSANKEYQREIEELTSRLDKADEFHHKKLQDFVKVLEERTRQISYLEKSMDEWKNQQSICQNCRKSEYSKAQAATATVQEIFEEGGEFEEDEQVESQGKEGKEHSSVDLNDNVNTQKGDGDEAQDENEL